MRTRTTVETLYHFDELSEHAQDHAIEKLWDLNVDDSYWFESTTEEIAEFGNVSGLGCEYGGEFDCDRASYVSITGVCIGISELLDKSHDVKDYPNIYDAVYTPFLGTFTMREQRHLRRLEQIEALGSLTGNTRTYSHGIRSEVEWWTDHRHSHVNALLRKLDTAWTQFLRDLEHTYLTMLREEYAYQTDREQIAESIRANEYEFDENGNMA